MNEHDADGDAGIVDGSEFADTDQIDYPREFLAQLRVELGAIGVQLATIEAGIAGYSVAERRAAMFGLDQYFAAVEVALGDARGVIADHVAALTMHLSRR